MEDEISKVPAHRTAVVRDQNAVLVRCDLEYLRIWNLTLIGFVRRLEINARFPTQPPCDNLHIEVSVSLEAGGHWRVVSWAWRMCSRRWNRAGLAARAAAFKALAWTVNAASAGA